MAIVKPDDIRFSQDSISNRFSRHGFDSKLIGEVLDLVCSGEIKLETFLQNMKIGRRPNFEGQWYTQNNRSLWVLKELRLNGVISDAGINFTVETIEPWRFTTKDEGKSIIVRSKPVGGTKALPAPFWRYAREEELLLLSGYDSDDCYED